MLNLFNHYNMVSLSSPHLFHSLHSCSPLAQLQLAQEEMISLEKEKEAELQEVQEELRSAQEEVLLLQQAAEEAAAERENDIACLQEELCRLRAELQRLHAAASQSELEMSVLRAEISGRGLHGHDPMQGRRHTLVALPLFHALVLEQLIDPSSCSQFPSGFQMK